MSRILSSSAHSFGVWIRNQNFKFIVWCMQKTIKCWRLSKWLCWSNAWWQYWNNFVYYNCWFTSQLLLYGRIVKCKSISLSRHDKTFYFSTHEIDFFKSFTQYTILTNYCQDLKVSRTIGYVQKGQNRMSTNDMLFLTFDVLQYHK